MSPPARSTILVQALGIDSGISKSQVSRICAKLDVEVDAFRNRSLAHLEFPYVYLDATYVKARDTELHQVVSRAVVIATGITANGDREVLGLAVGDSEAETFWTEFLRSLRRRGLAGVRLVISDAHEGLKTAARKTLQGASWQRCRVHFARNVLARVPKGHQDVVAAALRTVFVHPNPAEISAAWDRTADMFARQFPKVKELMDTAKGDVLAVRTYPPDHWRKIWSNNPLERLNKEIKRRTTLERRLKLSCQGGVVGRRGAWFGRSRRKVAFEDAHRFAACVAVRGRCRRFGHGVRSGVGSWRCGGWWR